MADITEDELERRLNDLSLQGVNLQPVLKQMMVAMQAETKRRFQTSTAPDGTPWLPLKLRKGKPLYDTGQHLMASCTATSARDAIRETTATGLRFGTSWEFAHVHQDGMEIHPVNSPFLVVPIPKGKPTRFLMLPSVTVPARPFLGWNEDLLEECSELLADYAIKKLEGK